MKKNKHTLRLKLFFYFIVFSLLIFALLWIFQIISFRYNYEKYVEKKLINSINDLKNNDSLKKEELYQNIDNTSYSKGICIEVIENKKIIYSTHPKGSGCLSFKRNNNNILHNKEKDFIDGDNSSLLQKIEHDNIEILLYGIKLDKDTIVLANTSVKPVDSTLLVLKNQLIIITFVTIIISIIMAFFIANKLSKPISIITEKSKKLSSGDFNVNFDVNTDLLEIDDLSKSLNYTRDVLKENDEFRRDLMANVSHDLKTPLTMIKAYAEMIRDLNFDNPEKRKNDLNIIVEEVDRLTILVNDILSLSKLESRIDKVEKVEFNLVSMIETIIQRFKIFNITKDYEFIFLAPKSIIIKADKQKMEQVLYNLISNAINYSSKSKKIYITLLVRKNIRVSISDTGPGIKEDEISKIWNKYYQADKKHKRNVVGTGLGLSIVKNIFEIHHYKYGVISKKNKGTTFYFEIKKSTKI